MIKKYLSGLGCKLCFLLNVLLCFKLVPGQILGRLYQSLVELISCMYIYMLATLQTYDSRMKDRSEGSV